LVSDVSGLAGLPVGVYQTELCQLEILPDGRLVIAGQDQLLAGASLPLGVGVAGVMQFAGVDLAAAIAMASTRPASLINYRAGGLQPGDLADLVLFHLHPQPTVLARQFEVQATVIAGQIAYGK
jgi:N-acetylglucosamine-6-phosphate deacetylase